MLSDRITGPLVNPIDGHHATDEERKPKLAQWQIVLGSLPMLHRRGCFVPGLSCLKVWFLFTCLGSASGQLPGAQPIDRTSVTLQLGRAASSVAPEFVSFNFDAASWTRLNLSSGTLNLLASALAPAHLRVGGTQGDYSIYSVGDAIGQNCENLPTRMTGYRCRVLKEAQFAALLGFCARNKLSLVFGLNDMFGRPTKTKPEKKLCEEESGCPLWNQTNAVALLKWIASQPLRGVIHGFELGNELNSCLNGVQGARSQAADFAVLATKVAAYFPGKQRPRLLGPDMHSNAEFSAKRLEWFEQFMLASSTTLDAFTFHMYVLGAGPKLDPANLQASFLNASALDKSKEGVKRLAAVMNSHGVTNELWDGETSSSNQGGHKDVTDTFINSFWFMDQLGSHAALGVKVFQRQVFAGVTGYPMVAKDVVNDKLVPLPDYWLALLHKRHMSQQVLPTSSSSPLARAYAHCSPDGGVSVMLLNLADTDVPVTFESQEGSLGTNRVDYVLQAGRPLDGAVSPLQSQEVLLNGVLLKLLPGPRLPELQGKPSTGMSLMLPPTSLAFVSFPQASAQPCKRPGKAPSQMFV